MSNTFKCPQKPSFKVPTGDGDESSSAQAAVVSAEPEAVPEVVPPNTNPAVPTPVTGVFRVQPAVVSPEPRVDPSEQSFGSQNDGAADKTNNNEKKVKNKVPKKKKEKDPNAPKRGMSAYLFFCQEERDRLLKEKPGLSLTERSKELGKRWQEMSPEDKVKFQEKAAEDKKRYEEEKTTYEKETPKVSQGPKRGKSPYIFFSVEMRATVTKECPEMKVPEIGKELGRRWNALAPSERAKYEEMAAEDKKRYAEEKERFDQTTAKSKKEMKKVEKNEKDGKTKNEKKKATAEATLELGPHKPEESKQKKRKVPKEVNTKSEVDNIKKMKKVSEKVSAKSVDTNKEKSGANSATKDALLRLQKLRVGGTWAMCSIKSCSKWRYLAEVLDPSEVVEEFTCRDCPDPRYDRCEAPEQEWDTDLAQHSVETRFTVGSLVWAKMDGFPAWPAMVDDDPNTGEFFWTEQTEDGWHQRPSSYHVIFFDEKVVRNWIPCSRLTKFDETKPDVPKSVLGSRLLKAFSRAVEAAGERLEERREKYCFARLYQGEWGPVWEECGGERMDLHLDDGDISQDHLGLGEDDMSFTDKSFSCDVLKTPVKTPVKPSGEKSNPVKDVDEETKVVKGKEESEVQEFDKENIPPQQPAQSDLPSVFSQDKKDVGEKSKPVNDVDEKTKVVEGKENSEDQEFDKENHPPQQQAQSDLPSVFSQDKKDATVKDRGLLTPVKMVAHGDGASPVKSFQTSTPVSQVKMSSCQEECEDEEDTANTSSPFDESFMTQ